VSTRDCAAALNLPVSRAIETVTGSAEAPVTVIETPSSRSSKVFVFEVTTCSAAVPFHRVRVASCASRMSAAPGCASTSTPAAAVPCSTVNDAAAPVSLPVNCRRNWAVPSGAVPEATLVAVTPVVEALTAVTMSSSESDAAVTSFDVPSAATMVTTGGVDQRVMGAVTPLFACAVLSTTMSMLPPVAPGFAVAMILLDELVAVKKSSEALVVLLPARVPRAASLVFRPCSAATAVLILVAEFFSRVCGIALTASWEAMSSVVGSPLARPSRPTAMSVLLRWGAGCFRFVGEG